MTIDAAVALAYNAARNNKTVFVRPKSYAETGHAIWIDHTGRVKIWWPGGPARAYSPPNADELIEEWEVVSEYTLHEEYAKLGVQNVLRQINE